MVGSLVVQDPSGARTAIELPALRLDESRADVVLPVPGGLHGLQLVGVVARGVPDPTSAAPTQDVDLALHVENLRVATGAPDSSAVPTLSDLAPGTVHTVSLANAGWNSDPSVSDVFDDARGLRLSARLAGRTRFGSVTTLAAVTFPDPSTGRARVDALVTPDVLDTLGLHVGDRLQVTVAGAPVRLEIAGTVPYLPGQASGGVLLDEDLLGRELLRAGSSDPLVDEWWLSVPDARAPAVAATLAKDGTTTVVRAQQRQDATDGPLHVGVQAALWIVLVAALTLAVSGLAMSAAVTVRSRRLEFARLQALGAPRAGLVRSVLAEHAILGTVGVLVGLALGGLLATVVAPLITTSQSGHPTCARRPGAVGLAEPAHAAPRAGGAGRGRRRCHHGHAAEAGLRRAPAAGGRAMTSLTSLRTGVRAATSGGPLVTRRRAVSDVGLLLLGALVLAVTVALCLVIPGLVARAADQAVRAAVVKAGTSADLVTRVGTSGRTGFGSSVASGRDPNVATTLRENAASVHDALPAPSRP